MAAAASEFERALADAGGADAPRERSAQLRRLLAGELERGARELGEKRTGYSVPIVVAVGPADRSVLVALPLPVELRADPGAVGERGAVLAAAAVEKLVEAAGPPAPAAASDLALQLGELDGRLTVVYPVESPREAADYAKEALDETLAGIDRLRARAHVVPARVLAAAGDLRPPIGATHPLRVAEAVTRLGGSPLDEESVQELEPQLLQLLEPPGSVARAHEDPDPARRVARRILQRLDGMGKWGGYHTAFDHLARGFAGHERSLAYEVGEALLAVGLLEEKPSVGQRHVYLNPRMSGAIRRLKDGGELPPGMELPAAGGPR
jgi:hypothetical protein